MDNKIIRLGIIKRDGVMSEVEVYRGDEVVAVVKVEIKGEYEDNKDVVEKVMNLLGIMNGR